MSLIVKKYNPRFIGLHKWLKDNADYVQKLLDSERIDVDINESVVCDNCKGAGYDWDDWTEKKIICHKCKGQKRIDIHQLDIIRNEYNAQRREDGKKWKKCYR